MVDLKTIKNWISLDIDNNKYIIYYNKFSFYN